MLPAVLSCVVTVAALVPVLGFGAPANASTTTTCTSIAYVHRGTHMGWRREISRRPDGRTVVAFRWRRIEYAVVDHREKCATTITNTVTDIATYVLLFPPTFAGLNATFLIGVVGVTEANVAPLMVYQDGRAVAGCAPVNMIVQPGASGEVGTCTFTVPTTCSVFTFVFPGSGVYLPSSNEFDSNCPL